MDLSFRPCSSSTTSATTSTSIGRSLRELRNRGDSDRLSSLPVELLIRILSLLPTKDAAATCLLSKTLKRVFPWITKLDFDDSLISYCLASPSRVELFLNYVTFVDNVLKQHQSQYLTRFRLQVGQQSRSKSLMFNPKSFCDGDTYCTKYCFPHLSSTQIYAWISLPLTRHGLTELDLRIRVRERGASQLPPEIFKCETLELLNLNVNLGLDLVLSMPSFRHPNLKKLELVAAFISGDGLVTKLLSCYPVLEDLSVVACYNHVHFTDISSSSLRRLHYTASYLHDECDSPDIMHINAPNLEHFVLNDNLASHYTVSKMDSLVVARINIWHGLVSEEPEFSFQQLVNLIRPLSNAQHLALEDGCTQDMNYAELKDELPVFQSLTHLELDATDHVFWDQVLFVFLNHCPAGFVGGVYDSEALAGQGFSCSVGREEMEAKEHEFCRTHLAVIPQCCRFNLKRIVVGRFTGSNREVELMQFLLNHALVLEELVVCHFLGTSLETTVQNLQRASLTCSIRFQKIAPPIILRPYFRFSSVQFNCSKQTLIGPVKVGERDGRSLTCSLLYPSKKRKVPPSTDVI